MIVEPGSTTAPPADAIPTVAHARVPGDFEPNYAIQHLLSDAGEWRSWDCAYTRVEADNLLAYYIKRYRSVGGEWRLAKIVYG